jgi:hypothetical protein
MTDKTSNPTRSTANRACANDSAIWMQKDAHWSKSPANPNTPNPFVQAQATASQTPSSSSAPEKSKQKES